MHIYYCEKCETRLTEEDLESGKALRDTAENIFCAACAPDSLNAPVRSGTRRFSARPAGASGIIDRQTPVNTPNSSARTSVATQPAERASTANASARNSSAPLPKQPFPVEWVVLGGGVLVLALVLGLYAFGGFGNTPKKNPATETAAATQTSPTTLPAATPVATTPLGTDTKSAVQPTANGKPAPTHEPDSRSVFDDVIKEHARDYDPEKAKAMAVRRFKEAAEFYKKYPQDPWTYADMLQQVPKGTPAGDDAVRTIAELKLPADKSDTPGWYRDWTFAAGASAIPRYDLDGRKNLLQTIPPGRDSELLFSRKIAVPADRPHLFVSARTEDKAACKIVVEIDGRQQLLDNLSGAGWRSFDFDLSAFKGKETDIQIRHIATSTSTPKAFWTSPVFRDAPQPGAKLIAYNSQATVYTKPKPVPPPAKHVFVAPISWKEAPAWKTPVDVLALADPQTGAVGSTWVRGDKGELQSSKANGARIAIAYTLPEQYDIRAVFERKSGNADVALILAHGGSQFVWTMGADNNKLFAISEVGGKKFENNPAIVRSGACLKNNQKRTTVVEVRKERISAYVDGKLVAEWVPSMGDLSLDNVWKLPDGKQLGLASWQGEVTFYSVELVEVK